MQTSQNSNIPAQLGTDNAEKFLRRRVG